ncbi:hypothetical protein EV401DRAFT_1932466 [Pisolithus croceorrhizus]|nr:hypothetical protein EV401DRAFT_1932466 [Pisolithus croceorrhizus]
MHTAEVSLRTNILGEPARAHVRPLSETRAIENGANALAEGFLFSVAAALIVGESFRASRAQSKRRDDVDDRLDELATSVSSLRDTVEQLKQTLEELEGEWERNDELQRIVERVVEIGLRGGWVEFEDTPLRIPKADLTPQTSRLKSSGSSTVESEPTSSSDVNSASSSGLGPS